MASFTFGSVSADTTYNVDITATATGTSQKTKRIFVTIKPAGAGGTGQAPLAQ